MIDTGYQTSFSFQSSFLFWYFQKNPFPSLPAIALKIPPRNPTLNNTIVCHNPKLTIESNVFLLCSLKWKFCHKMLPKYLPITIWTKCTVPTIKTQHLNYRTRSSIKVVLSGLGNMGIHKNMSDSDLECIFQSVTYDWETWITYTEKLLGDSKEWGMG